jgi:hypothetical protein
MSIRTKLGRIGIRTIFFACICLALSAVAPAATYWVSPTGSASWASCVGSTPLSGSAACSLASANANAVAGDLVYLRGGTYNISGTAIQPSHSGTSATAMITFAAYTGETPIITGSTNGFWMDNNSYISIQGITFSNIQLFRIHNGSHHNEIARNTFTSTTGDQEMLISGASNQNWVTHNWIHDNHFILTGQAKGAKGLGCTDGGGDVMDIGNAQGAYTNTVENDNNNTIENNFFEHAPHAVFDNFGMYNVFRNNIIHNEPWSTASPACAGAAINPATYSSSNPNYSAYNGKYAHRNFQISEDYNRPATYLLVEGNRSGYAGVNDTNDGADNFSLAAPQNIVRYNFFYAAMNPGMMFKYAWNYGAGAGGHGGTYNRVYNNTFYDNGIGYPWGSSCSLSTCPWSKANVSLYVSGSGEGNVLKNNLMYQGTGFSAYGADVLNKTNPSSGWSAVTGGVANNWCTGSQSSNGGCSAFGDPKFSNPDISDPTSKTLPDLSLQSSSPAIDGGTSLTTATNSGSNSTTLTVADALYFQDGTWGSDLAKASTGIGGTAQADWIAIGTVTNVVQIKSITYGAYNNPAGTITLASPVNWSAGAPIWLQKKSDGKMVLAGAAPDYGASEYTGTGGTGGTPPAPPTNIQAVVH